MLHSMAKNCDECTSNWLCSFSLAAPQQPRVGAKGEVLVRQSQGWGLRVGFVKGGTFEAAEMVVDTMILKFHLERKGSVKL